jgi:hypothetical protein
MPCPDARVEVCDFVLEALTERDVSLMVPFSDLGADDQGSNRLARKQEIAEAELDQLADPESGVQHEQCQGMVALSVRGRVFVPGVLQEFGEQLGGF